jgi:hypothetical protein
VQQALEETLGGRSVPSILHQDVQHDTSLIHRTPQVMQHAPDADENLIEVPRVPRPGTSPAQPCCEVGSELLAPVTDTLVSNRNAALSQDQLHISQTEAENMIQPHRMADDLGWEAMAMIRTRLWRHPASFT